ncbi:Site-specific recombinase XerD [Paenibacillus sp. 1_12]|uniref:site-specific integrase n=1 Tax=Paenibacillus sp. 1_12 TaxID=1566278 RepID=UPI0008F1D39C|nr:site-specific integrase [Paenibacillus sp. 1_12]SFL86938.1 Site-specific recombinase XerD [Paenibacillus sp. 1_12]
MKGHVRQRKPSGKWELSVPLGFDKQGKKVRFTQSGFDTKEEAEKALVEKLYEKNRDVLLPRSKVTVYSHFLSWLEIKKVKVRLGTYNNLVGYLENHVGPELGYLALSQLTTQRLELFYLQLEKKMSARTIKYIHSMIRQSLNRAVKLQLLAKNPAIDVDTPKISKNFNEPWTAEEALKFLQTAKSSRWYLSFLLVLQTGLRQGELLALRWGDIDLDARTLNVHRSLTRAEKGFELGGTKTTGSARTIALPVEVVNELRLRKDQKCVVRKGVKDVKDVLDERVFNRRTDFVTHARNGNFVSPHNFIKEWKRVLLASKVRPIRFHDLRHTHATLLLESGVNVKAVAERLGHSTSSTTLDFYAHVTRRMEEGVVAALQQVLPVN